MSLSLLLLLCSLQTKHIRDKPNCFIHGKNNWFIQKRIRDLEKEKPSRPACGQLCAFARSVFQKGVSRFGGLETTPPAFSPSAVSITKEYLRFVVTNRLGQ